jgi:hypothetical protein
MVIAFIVFEPRFIEVFYDLCVCGVNYMTTIAGKNAEVIKLVGYLGERRGKLLKQVSKGG